MIRLPLILILFSVGLIFVSQIQPLKREIVYKLGISGDSTTSCCNIDQLSDGKFDKNASVAIFNNQLINYPQTSLTKAQLEPDTNFAVVILSVAKNLL